MPYHVAKIGLIAISACFVLTICGCDRLGDATERGVFPVAERGHDVVVRVNDDRGEPVERATVRYDGIEMENLGPGLYTLRLLRPVGGLVVSVSVGGKVVERRVPEDAIKRENEEVYDVLVVVFGG